MAGTKSHRSKRKTQTKTKKPSAVSGPVHRDPTKRERQIAQLIVDGLSNQEIADKLKLSPKTVEAHRANLYRKLQVRNTAQLIQVGLPMGLIEVKAPKAVAV